MITKNAVITIAGRPNVGKSTLLNALVGEKVAIVTNKPQTTRNRICAVLNRGETQLVFVDTPGYHKSRNRLGAYMVRVVRENVSHVEAVMLLVEPINHIGAQERQLLEWIRKSGAPTVLVINKIDTVRKDALLAVMETYAAAHAFDAVLPISAKTGDGVEGLLEVLAQYAAPGPQLFPDGQVSDQPDKQIVAEIVREKLLLHMDREIPHGTAVEVTRFTERDSGVIDLDVTIYCEKASHKGMIIGKNGKMLKTVATAAREEIEAFMGTKVFMQTWVKVKEKWRDSDYQLRNFGYTE